MLVCFVAIYKFLIFVIKFVVYLCMILPIKKNFCAWFYTSCCFFCLFLLFQYSEHCFDSDLIMTQELNIGGSIVVAALEEACGTKKSKVRELYNSLGDLGRSIYHFRLPDNWLHTFSHFSFLWLVWMLPLRGWTLLTVICIGDVAQLCRQTQSLLAPPVALTVRGVYSALRRIRYYFDSSFWFWQLSLLIFRWECIVFSYSG